jgi:hypothetical protein
VKWGSVAALDSLGQNPQSILQRGWYPTVYGSWTFPNTISPFQSATRDLIYTSGNNVITVLGADYGGFRKIQLSGASTQIRCNNRPIYCEWLDLGAGTILSLVGGNGGTGNASAGGSAGAVGAIAQTFGGGTAGGAGSKTVGSTAPSYGGNTYMDPPTFAGGNGGLGASGAGGGATPAGVAEIGYSWTRPPFCWNITDANGGKLYAGAGGGGGGGDTTNGGGGGGAGGGVILISARRITRTGTITVAGGNGGAATVGNCGGGGGGGGGLIVIHTPQDPATINLTFNVSGGTGGAKSGTGVAGSNGSAGAVIMFSGYNQTSWLS